MANTGRKGAMRYLVFATIPWVLAKSFERLGDRAVLEAGIGNGAGVPYYIVALVLVVISLALFLFALKRSVERIMGRDKAEPPAPGAPLLTPNHAASSDEPFDPDAALQRYMQNRPDDVPAPVVPAARPGGFGKKGL